MSATLASHVDYVLGLADDALVSAQRMGWWISRAPQLEEDLALANIGLDLLGQARALLSHAGELEGEGRDEDDLAYWRDERDFRNVKLVERPQEDFGVAMARLLVLSTWQSELYAALQRSTDPVLAAVGGQGLQGGRLPPRPRQPVGAAPRRRHRRVARPDAGGPGRRVALGRGALRRVPPRPGPGRPRASRWLPRACASPSCGAWATSYGRRRWRCPTSPARVPGGRAGLHTEHLGRLLAEMQHLTRSHPGATW